jgi:predicted GH43/DUF377 family glycosyl hydrolase
MILALVAHILGLFVSAFVGGVLIGAIFSSGVRTGITAKLKHWKEYIHPKVLVLARSAANPVLAPSNNMWEAAAVFNPAALNLAGRTHLIYRAIGVDGVSRLGYASSADGIRFDERLPYPIYAAHDPRKGLPLTLRRYDPVMYPSGGSWGGCEDPRTVVIDGRVYLTFNGFDSWDCIRIGLISIEANDFLNKNWNWSTEKLLSKNGERHKNWMLFPEKIGGRFALLHSIICDDENRVRIEYVDDFDTYDPEKQSFESPDPQREPDRNIAWHYHMRSAAAPPVRTDKGWLLFYHAMDIKEPNRYKVGAMLLDLADPTRVIARASRPVLEPDMQYENDGKPGIVYASGAVVRDGTLYLYYGGGDRTTAVATVNLNEFVNALTGHARVEFTSSPALQRKGS